MNIKVYITYQEERWELVEATFNPHVFMWRLIIQHPGSFECKIIKMIPEHLEEVL